MTALAGSLRSSRSVRIIGAAAVGIILGLAVMTIGPMLTLAGLLGLGAAALAFTRPEILILVVLAFASNLIPTQFNPFLRSPIGRIQLSEILLLWLLFVVVFRVFTDESFRFRRTPLDVPLLLFYSCVLLGLATAVIGYGISFINASYEARQFMYYLLFFPITNLLRARRQVIWFTRGMIVIAILVAISMLIESVFGGSVAFLDNWVVEDSNVARVFHPGYPVVFFVLFALLAYRAMSRHDRLPVLAWLQLFILALAILSTLARSLLISVGLCLVLLLVTLRMREQSRLVRDLAIVAALGAGLIAIITASGSATQVLQSGDVYVARIARMFSSQILSPDETVYPRVLEIRYAWQAIVDHPILGIGLYNVYRPPVYAIDPENLRRYIHNSYLSIWLKTGIFGLLSFLWFSLAYLRRGFKHWSQVRDPFLRATVLGFVAAYASMAVANFVLPSFVQPWLVIIYGVAPGVSEAILMANAQEKQG